MLGHGGLEVSREQNSIWMLDLNRKAEMTLCWSLKFVRKRNEQKWDGMLRCHSFPGGSRHCMAFDHKSTNQWEMSSSSVLYWETVAKYNIAISPFFVPQQYSDWKTGSSVGSTSLISSTFQQKNNFIKSQKKKKRVSYLARFAQHSAHIININTSYSGNNIY